MVFFQEKVLVRIMIFRRCSNCGRTWGSRHNFIFDNKLVISGYQASFQNIDNGLFLFTDTNDGCGTTIAVRVKEFMDLYQGIVYSERKTGSDVCEGKCLNLHDTTPCKAECELAHIREIIKIIINLKKTH